MGYLKTMIVAIVSVVKLSFAVFFVQKTQFVIVNNKIFSSGADRILLFAVPKLTHFLKMTHVPMIVLT